MMPCPRPPPRRNVRTLRIRMLDEKMKWKGDEEARQQRGSYVLMKKMKFEINHDRRPASRPRRLHL